MQIEANDMGPIQLVKRHNPLSIPKETEDLIVAGVSQNTLRAYRRITQAIEAWLNGREFSDTLLASYHTLTNI